MHSQFGQSIPITPLQMKRTCAPVGNRTQDRPHRNPACLALSHQDRIFIEYWDLYGGISHPLNLQIPSKASLNRLIRNLIKQMHQCAKGSIIPIFHIINGLYQQRSIFSTNFIKDVKIQCFSINVDSLLFLNQNMK